MASVFSSLNLGIIFGNRKMLFWQRAGDCIWQGLCRRGTHRRKFSPFCGQMVALRSKRQIMQKYQTGEAKQILQWRKEGTGAGNSANEERPRLTEWENPSSGHHFLSSLRCSAGKQIAETCWGATVELPGVVKPSASVVAIIQQFPQLPLWEAALLSLWFKNLE